MAETHGLLWLLLVWVIYKQSISIIMQVTDKGLRSTIFDLQIYIAKILYVQILQLSSISVVNAELMKIERRAIGAIETTPKYGGACHYKNIFFPANTKM